MRRPGRLAVLLGFVALLAAGCAYVTDGVGRPIAIDDTVFPGAIYRVVRSPRRSED